MNRTRAERRYNRYVKGMRRIREDRAQHGSDLWCECFDPDGRVFSQFADNPQMIMNPWRHFKYPSLQERRAPTVHDWD
jgi:hypothetical protein